MVLHSSFDQQFDLVVVGGGAAGFMAAITAIENGLSSVCILEATSKPLEKVRISGGGRCNVTHACWESADLVTNYPRGSISLMSPFSRFSTGDAVAWFSEKGVDLVAEEDGRMFPVANTSFAVVNCLQSFAKDLGVFIHTNSMVTQLHPAEDHGFFIHCGGKKSFFARRVLLATGGHPIGRRLAKALGHNLVKSVPSLFTLALDAPELKTCSGISLDNVKLILKVGQDKFEEFGKVLLTHWGLSGPATLRLSAFAARSLYNHSYRAKITVNWTGNLSRDDLANLFKDFRYQEARKKLVSLSPLPNIPKRLWLSFLKKAGVDLGLRWADFSSKMERKLLEIIENSSYDILAKGPFGEEFVTAGGIEIKEVNMTNMQSIVCPGLYFAGEILNIDGVTGGFNFQHCWSSGWIAGSAIAKELCIL